MQIRDMILINFFTEKIGYSSYWNFSNLLRNINKAKFHSISIYYIFYCIQILRS